MDRMSTSCTCFPIWVEFGVPDLHVMLLRISEFRKSWQRKGGALTFHMLVNSITLTSVP